MSDTTINRLTMAKAEGKRLRKKVAREDHATLELPKHRDVLDLIHQRNKGRIPELIPVRMQRMSASAFAFFRGSADLMAYDLTASPTIGLNMVLCGDAHLANFGLFASPERRVLFDLNDFDESGIGPWEWDIKRLAASAVLAAREGDVHADDDDARDIVINLVDNYRTAMRTLPKKPFSTATMPTLTPTGSANTPATATKILSIEPSTRPATAPACKPSAKLLLSPTAAASTSSATHHFSSPSQTRKKQTI